MSWSMQRRLKMKLDRSRGKKSEWYSKYFEKEIGLSPEDQRWIWENVSLTGSGEKEIRKTNVSVNGSINGTCKNGVSAKLTLGKHEVITRLKECNYRTPPRKIAFLLEKLFDDPETEEGHWLFIAQHWPPRAINRTITQMIKRHKRGESTIRNAAAYFTAAIRRRKKRKCFRSTNDTYRQQ